MDENHYGSPSTVSPSRRRLQFSLLTVLLWLVPYACLVAWVISWHLPENHTPSDPMVLGTVKAICIGALTLALLIVAVVAYIRRWVMSYDDRQANERAP